MFWAISSILILSMFFFIEISQHFGFGGLIYAQIKANYASFAKNLDLRKIPPPKVVHNPNLFRTFEKCLSCCSELRSNKNGWLDVLWTQWFHRSATGSISSLQQTACRSLVMFAGVFLQVMIETMKRYIFGSKAELVIGHWIPFYSYVNASPDGHGGNKL